MYMDYFFFAVAATLAGCGLVLVMTSWYRPNKNAADWAMAIGSLCSLFGAVGLVTALAEVQFIRTLGALLVITSAGTLGVILFTMGFAVDRVKYYRKKTDDDYRKQILPPQ